MNCLLLPFIKKNTYGGKQIQLSSSQSQAKWPYWAVIFSWLALVDSAFSSGWFWLAVAGAGCSWLALAVAPPWIDLVG